MRKYKTILLFWLVVLLISNPLFPEDKKFELIPNKSPDEVRILKILIVADQIYQKQIPDWQNEIVDLVTMASDIFYKQAGIKLEIVGLRSWQRGSLKGSSYLDLLNELTKDFRTKTLDFEVLIGLTSHYLDAAAWCRIREGNILIRNKRAYVSYDEYGDIRMIEYPLMSSGVRKERYLSLILHEIGHIFDCSHCKNITCAMSSTNTYPTEFCGECIQTIKKWKWRKIPNLEENK